MSTRFRCVLSALPFALALSATSALAQDIYRWVDADGTVNFSDTAPTSVGDTVSTVTIEDTRSSDYDPEADIYDVAGQAERMRALREEMALEQEARREREQNAANQSAPANDRPPHYGYPYAYPPYLRPHPRPPARPPAKPRPPRPEPYETSTLRPPGQPQEPSRP